MPHREDLTQFFEFLYGKYFRQTLSFGICDFFFRFLFCCLKNKDFFYHELVRCLFTFPYV